MKNRKAPRGYVKRSYKNPAKPGSTVRFKNGKKPFYITHFHGRDDKYVVGVFLKPYAVPDVHPGSNSIMVHSSEVEFVKIRSDQAKIEKWVKENL